MPTVKKRINIIVGAADYDALQHLAAERLSPLPELASA